MSSSSKKPSSAASKAGSSPKRRSKSPTKHDSPGKGKAKTTGDKPRRAKDEDVDMDDAMEEDDNDDDEEEDNDDSGDDENDETEDSFEEIDPSAIVGRRTRGVKVDYTSAEAIARAGVGADNGDEEEE